MLKEGRSEDEPGGADRPSQAGTRGNVMDSFGFYPNEKHLKVFRLNQILFIFLEKEIRLRLH